MFRSEKMGFYNLVLPRESAWQILNEIGSISTLHFIDMFKKKKKNSCFFPIIKYFFNEGIPNQQISPVNLLQQSNVAMNACSNSQISNQK